MPQSAEGIFPLDGEGKGVGLSHYLMNTIRYALEGL
jgi:hypothetical protein